MSLALKLRTRALERRRHQRVRVVLLGRFMLENQQEYPCQSMNISPGGIALLAPVQGRVGERIVIYLEHLGRLEGTVVRQFELGFAVQLAATRRKQDKLANQLTWLANRHELGLPEDRRHERLTPRRTAVLVRMPNGKEAAARIIDLSMSGAALTVGVPIAIGTAVTVGSTPARVVRHFGSGIGVEFVRPITEDMFDEDVVL
ncbi:PilZ domain-containing protein [Alsobacter sp. R-9]